jgi:hypothetical protein
MFAEMPEADRQAAIRKVLLRSLPSAG